MTSCSLIENTERPGAIPNLHSQFIIHLSIKATLFLSIDSCHLFEEEICFPRPGNMLAAWTVNR